ncbi:hypothetical protein BH23THE1_BH23THE1_35420 [soil metagenome]
MFLVYYGQFVMPIRITTDSSKNLYVTDMAIGVQKFDSEWNFDSSWNAFRNSSERLFVGEPYSTLQHSINPIGISIDWKDNVYVTEYSGKVLEFDTNGNLLGEWGSEGAGTGQFLLPAGIAVDFEDNVYVTDSINHRVPKVRQQWRIHYHMGIYGEGRWTIHNSYRDCYRFDRKCICGRLLQ